MTNRKRKMKEEESALGGWVLLKSLVPGADGEELVADVYGSEAAAGTPVGVYGGGAHGGDNQLWRLGEEDGRVATALLSSEDGAGDLCLAVGGEEGEDGGGRPVLLAARGEATRFSAVRAGGGDAVVLAALDRELVLTHDGGARLLAAPRDPDDRAQLWRMEPAERDPPRPATSCHLTYRLPEGAAGGGSWELRCSCVVELSADCTYFCVVGWGPGGYSGVQQLQGGRRKAIFSMWDGGGEGEAVAAVEAGEGVAVGPFGGEGTGMKSMRDLDWAEGRPVTVTVRGKREEEGAESGGKETWACSCWVETAGGERHFMATFRRTAAARPLSAGGFYSFVEDWDRSPGARGHLAPRRAAFFGQEPAAAAATFTKVRHGADAYAADRATGGACPYSPAPGYYLSTGGGVVEDGTTLLLPAARP